MGGNAIPTPVRLRRDLASHCMALRKYMCKDLQCISHVAVSVSQSCVSSQHGCCSFIFSPKEFQHLFNKSEKGCKQNALCCSNRDWRVFQKPCGDIKAMQIASLSQRCVCHKWVCDIGIVKPFTSNKDNEGMPSQGLGVPVNSELDLIPA